MNIFDISLVSRQTWAHWIANTYRTPCRQVNFTYEFFQKNQRGITNPTYLSQKLAISDFIVPLPISASKKYKVSDFTDFDWEYFTNYKNPHYFKFYFEKFLHQWLSHRPNH